MPALPRPLFDHLEEVLGPVREGGRWGLFCDYDGTLSPLVPHADQALLPAKTRNLLERLARHPRYSLALVSGRTLSDLRARAGIPGVALAGTHGLEVESGGERFVHPAAEGARGVMARLRGELEAALRGTPGAWVEDKAYTLALHYRQVAPGARGALLARAREAAESLHREGRLEPLEGNMVLEFRPPGGWDKGKAVRWLRERAGAGGGGPLAGVFYLGDDATDEDAFAALGGGDVGVLVAEVPRPTRARFWVRGPEEVARFLESLAGVPG